MIPRKTETSGINKEFFEENPNKKPDLMVGDFNRWKTH